MLDWRYKLDYIGVDSTSQKEQKRRKSDKAQSRRLDEAPIDCTFRRELQNSKSRRIQLTGLDPGDWIKGPESGRNYRNFRPRESKRLDWIQPIGLVNSNQAETSVFENLVEWIRANSVLIKQKLQSSRIQSKQIGSNPSSRPIGPNLFRL